VAGVHLMRRWAQESWCRVIQLFSLLVTLAVLSGCAMDHYSGEIFVMRPAGHDDSADELPVEGQARVPSTVSSNKETPSAEGAARRGLR
jgi:hypothetical protein